MGGLEFYIFGSELWCKHDDGRNEIVDETKVELIEYLLDTIREYYPEAYKALEKLYSKSSANIRYYQYLIARRFCKCNFSKLETTHEDIDKKGSFHFEKVECPMRGECPLEKVVCQPKFNSNLSIAEKRVMKLYYEGLDKEQIASELFISPETVKVHIRNSYVKLGIHDKAEFIRLANSNNMFNS